MEVALVPRIGGWRRRRRRRGSRRRRRRRGRVRRRRRRLGRMAATAGQSLGGV